MNSQSGPGVQFTRSAALSGRRAGSLGHRYTAEMSASQPGASSSTDVGVVETCMLTGVPKSSDGALAQPPTISTVAIRPASSRRSPDIERRAKAARQVARLVAELRRGLGGRAPIGDADRRLRDLAEIVGEAHRPGE